MGILISDRDIPRPWLNLPHDIYPLYIEKSKPRKHGHAVKRARTHAQKQARAVLVCLVSHTHIIHTYIQTDAHTDTNFASKIITIFKKCSNTTHSTQSSPLRSEYFIDTYNKDGVRITLIFAQLDNRTFSRTVEKYVQPQTVKMTWSKYASCLTACHNFSRCCHTCSVMFLIGCPALSFSLGERV